MILIVLLVVLAIAYWRYRSWWETPKGRMVLDGIIVLVVLAVMLTRGLHGSRLIWLEALIGVFAVYDAVMMIRNRLHH